MNNMSVKDYADILNTIMNSFYEVDSNGKEYIKDIEAYEKFKNMDYKLVMNFIDKLALDTNGYKNIIGLPKKVIYSEIVNYLSEINVNSMNR